MTITMSGYMCGAVRRRLCSCHSRIRALTNSSAFGQPYNLNPNPRLALLYPKGPKYLYGTKYGFLSSNFPYGLGKDSPYGYLGPFGIVKLKP